MSTFDKALTQFRQAGNTRPPVDRVDPSGGDTARSLPAAGVTAAVALRDPSPMFAVEKAVRMTVAGMLVCSLIAKTARDKAWMNSPHAHARSMPVTIDETAALLAGAGYIADRALATVLHLSLVMKRPLFLEGEAGVGKTEIAKVLSETLGRKLIRLQCYEGLDLASAVYEWNYPQQMVEIRLAEASGTVDRDELGSTIFSEKFLIKRPVLQALESDLNGAPVFLIDELDRADEAFEAFLLEVLADSQVTIPELGTIKAKEPPIVIITTNRTREIHDALKRRCLYHWVDYPDAVRELQIVRSRLPGVAARLSSEVVAFVQRLRKMELFKAPGVAETLDWATALTELNEIALDPAVVSDTLGVLLKYQDDIQRIHGSEARRIVDEIRQDLARV